MRPHRNPNFIHYLDKVQEVYDEHYPVLRLGQTYFNVLCDFAPNLAMKITGTEYDPFNSDERIIEFIKYVQDNFTTYD